MIAIHLLTLIVIAWAFLYRHGRWVRPHNFDKFYQRTHEIEILQTPLSAADLLGSMPKEYLQAAWTLGASLGKYCNCQDKIEVESNENIGMKAYVKYCYIHGFTTDCYICSGTHGENYMFSTELCSRDHSRFIHTFVSIEDGSTMDAKLKSDALKRGDLFYGAMRGTGKFPKYKIKD